jgi:DNA-binding HxlR family transcriptional regulator
VTPIEAGTSADACDLVGKRWALRVVRELALGPQRYTDLQRRLAGISTNVLAARLHELLVADVARRRLLPPPAGSVVYELTERGRELGRIVLALDEWGTRTRTAVAREPVRPGRREGRAKGVGAP